MVGSFSDLGQYRRYLRALHGFRAPLEREAARALPRFAGGTGDWRPRFVAPAMEADMADLGMTPDRGEDMARPARDGAELMGLLYVLEGASLGARILSARAAGLGLGAEFGARHLALQSHGLDGWRGFLDLLEGLDGFDLPRAAGAANAAFARAQDMFAAA